MSYSSELPVLMSDISELSNLLIAYFYLLKSNSFFIFNIILFTSETFISLHLFKKMYNIFMKKLMPIHGNH